MKTKFASTIKLFFIISIFFSIASCSREETDDANEISEFAIESKSTQSSLTPTYFNDVAKASNFNDINFTEVDYFDIKNQNKVENISGKYGEYNFDNAITTEVSIPNRNVIIHVLPFKDFAKNNKADVFVEENGIFSTSYINIDITDTETGYSSAWRTVHDNTSREGCDGSIISCDCEEGASDIQALGTVVAGGALFGCVPCGFAGGAVAVLGAIGQLLC